MADERKAEILREGDKFGDYTVLRLLGKGGMGAVYLMQGTSGSQYAVKIMFPEKVSHEMRRRFAKEAEFAIKIRHRNLVSVYDVGEDPETSLCYMIMDYVPGGTLSDRLKEKGRFSIQEAVPIVSQIAAALDVALYEMLSVKRPNDGRTVIEPMAKAIKGEPLPDIKTMCPELSVAVAHVVSLLCAPKPEARPHTALGAADLLRKAASGRHVLAMKKPQSSAAEAAALEDLLRRGKGKVLFKHGAR